jgi:nucleoside-diphosphate-sugar epimerase
MDGTHNAGGRVLVTGGSGFIGTNLVEHLLSGGREVLSLDTQPPRDPAHEAAFRLIGTDGMIEVADKGDYGLRMMNADQAGWQTLMSPAPIHGAEYHVMAVLDLIAALKEGREPELSARKALQATEVMFAAYESARRGGRVDLPLAIDDSPLAALIAASD